MSYGNPKNSAATTARIQLIRKHFMAMSQGVTIAANVSLPKVACPSSTR